jgi:hypothetical protein
LLGLRTRLSADCVARNRYLLYHERHQQAITTGSAGLKLGEKTAVDDVTGGTDMESTALTAEPVAMEEHSIALQDTSSVVSGSTLSYLTQTGKDIRFKALELESVSRGQSSFSCPYCHDEQLLGTSRPTHEQQKRWEKHVFADLKTYVCLEEHCSSQMFESSHAWLRHQLSHHLKEWRCRACNVDQTLDTLQSLKEHYYTQHRLVHEDDDFLQLAEASEVLPKTVSVVRCKFCKWPEFLPKGVDRVSTSRFRKHLGSHLEQIALGMVPEKYRMLDETKDDDVIDDTSNAALTVACESGDVEECARLLAVNSGSHGERMAQGFTVAVRSGHHRLVQWLLERGASVNTLHGSGKCSLYPPSESGDREMVMILLEAGADVDFSDASGTTALHLAAQRGYSAVVRTLLGAGADVDFSDASGTTALHLAAQRGHDAVVRALLRHGADFSAVDASGNTSLSLALSSNHSRVIDLLRDRSEKREAASGPDSLQSQRIFDDPEEEDEDDGHRMVGGPRGLYEAEESFSRDDPPPTSTERHPKHAAKTNHQNTSQTRITKKAPAGLRRTEQRPSEFDIGDIVAMDVQNRGKIAAGNFVIEDRRYFAASQKWTYRLSSLGGAVHERGLWYPEDSLAPK